MRISSKGQVTIPQPVRTAIGLLALLAAGLIACASSTATSARERCERDARARYQWCLNPNFIPEGEPMPVRNSEESQSCRVAYQQALSVCANEAAATELPLGARTGTVAD